MNPPAGTSGTVTSATVRRFACRPKPNRALSNGRSAAGGATVTVPSLSSGVGRSISTPSGMPGKPVTVTRRPSMMYTTVPTVTLMRASSLEIVPVAAAVPNVTPAGRPAGTSRTVNVSSGSATSSSVVGTMTVADLSPAGIVRLRAGAGV